MSNLEVHLEALNHRPGATGRSAWGLASRWSFTLPWTATEPSLGAAWEVEAGSPKIGPWSHEAHQVVVAGDDQAFAAEVRREIARRTGGPAF